MNPVKVAIKNIAKKYGFHISRCQQQTGMYPNYEPVYPYATYSPWNTDAAFDAAFSKIEGATLVDKYRCFELWKLVEQAAKLKNGAIIEIGAAARRRVLRDHDLPTAARRLAAVLGSLRGPMLNDLGMQASY